MTKFRTFFLYEDSDKYRHCTVYKSAATQINEWLEVNPQVVIQSWQATPVGDHNELYITIQYTED